MDSKKENSKGLTIRAVDFNLVLSTPTLLKKLRKLTLHSYSGLSKEINRMEAISTMRPVKCQALISYVDGIIVGWAMMSREASDYPFRSGPFKEGDGVLFEVYIDPPHRRKGIGSELMKIARRKSSGDRICIVPWDTVSTQFYSKFDKYNHKKM